MVKSLLIAIGGAIGSVARYWVSVSMASWLGSSFPFGTFCVNLSACFAIGFAIPYMGKQSFSNSPWRFLLAVGFVGAFSTFSTFEWETLSMLRNGHLALTLAYAAGSLLLGLIAVWCGSKLARVLSIRPFVTPSPDQA